MMFVENTLLVTLLGWAIVSIGAFLYALLGWLVVASIGQWRDQRRKTHRRAILAAESIERINVETDQSIQRIASAYRLAQSEMRRIARDQ
jgi:hypothetical protein